LHSRTLHESSMRARSWAWSYRKKGKEGGPTYSKYLPLLIVTHFMFLMFALPEACFGFPKIEGWMFPLPNTPHSSYLPSRILSHITFMMFAVHEVCFWLPKIEGWMFPLPNTPHSSYLPSRILSHITFVMFAVHEACFWPKDGCSHYQICSFLVLALTDSLPLYVLDNCAAGQFAGSGLMFLGSQR